MLHEDITGPLLAAFYEVHHDLGHGFLESVYERAMIVALSSRGLVAARQVPVAVHYRGQVIGNFAADLLVEGCVIAELKSCRALESIHDAQLLNSLRATRIEVGLLLHFAPKPAFKRFVLTNDRKVGLAGHTIATPVPNVVPAAVS